MPFVSPCLMLQSINPGVKEFHQDPLETGLIGGGRGKAVKFDCALPNILIQGSIEVSRPFMVEEKS